MVNLRVTIMVNISFFQNYKKNLDRALKTIVLHISWTSLGLFSLKQVFWHLYFIVSSMHLDAILCWQIFSTNFVGKFFRQVFFWKKHILMVILRVMSQYCPGSAGTTRITSREAGRNSCCSRRTRTVLTLLTVATSRLRPRLRSYLRPRLRSYLRP